MLLHTRRRHHLCLEFGDYSVTLRIVKRPVCELGHNAVRSRSRSAGPGTISSDASKIVPGHGRTGGIRLLRSDCAAADKVVVSNIASALVIGFVAGDGPAARGVDDRVFEIGAMAAT
jgi:hypothetical protein